MEYMRIACDINTARGVHESNKEAIRAVLLSNISRVILYITKMLKIPNITENILKEYSDTPSLYIHPDNKIK